MAITIAAGLVKHGCVDECVEQSGGHGENGVCLVGQVEASVVDEPQVIVFKGSFKLAPEPRGVARSAALAAAEMVLVSPLMSVSLSVSLSVWLHCLHVLYTSTTRTISAFVSVGTTAVGQSGFIVCM